MTRADQRFQAGSFAFLFCLLTSAVLAIAEDPYAAPLAQEQTVPAVEGGPDQGHDTVPKNDTADALAWAEDDDADLGTSEDDGELTLLTMLSKLGLGLGVVVLLGWGIVTVLKKTAIAQQFGSAGSVIQVVERNYLAPKKAIYLVQIGQKVLALGVTDAQIGLLSVWNEGDIDLSKDKAGGSFAGHMKSMVAGLGNKQSPLAEAQS